MSRGTRDATIEGRIDRPRGTQFSLRGMFVLLLSVAIGLSAQLPDGKNPVGWLVVAAVVWIVVGLANQVRDLWAAGYARNDLAADDRWACGFAVAWRVAVAAVLVGSCLVEGLVAAKRLTLPERPGEVVPTGAMLRQAVFSLSLLAVLLSVPRRARRHRASRPSRAIALLAWPAAALLCIYHCLDQTLIPFLVYVAVSGIEHSAPLHLRWEGVDLDLTARAHRFLAWTFAAAVVATANLLAAPCVPKWWRRPGPSRVALGGLLGLGLGASSFYVVWAATRGVRAFSPAMAEAMTVAPLYRWFLAVGIVAVFATVLAYRATRRTVAAVPGMGLDWRREEGRYYHERTVVIATLLAAIAGKAGFGLYREYETLRQAYLVAVSPTEWLLTLGMPSFYLQAAVFLACLASLWAAWHPPADRAATALASLPPGPFVATWLACFLALVCGLPAIVALSFAVRLGPWTIM